MLAARKVKRDPLSLLDGDDAASEHARAFVGRLTGQPQHAHAGIIIVQHLALRPLPDQLVECRLDRFCRFGDDLPLGGGGQRDAQAVL